MLCDESDFKWAGQWRDATSLFMNGSELVSSLFYILWELLDLGMWCILLFHSPITVKIILNNSDKKRTEENEISSSIPSSPFL